MENGETFRNASLRLRMALVALALAIALSGFLGLPRIERYFLVQAGNDQAATLRLAVESLRGTLERYAPIPSLIAARPEIKAVIANPNNRLLRGDAERLLAQTAIALRASGVYLEDERGIPLVAVPPIGTSAAGGNIAYRPYFSQTVAGGLGQYYALGTQSGERGFFYAAPVRGASRIEGVVAVKFAVDQFEAAWREGRAEIIVRDANDIVFMSSRPEWNFRAMVPLSAEKMRLIAAAKQFPIDQIKELPNRVRALTDKLSIVEIDDGGATQSYISSTALIARAGWRVTILTPTQSAFALARTTAISGILLTLLAAALAAVVWQNRMRLSERMEAQRAAQEMLEKRVQERTTELNEANFQLVAEIEERKAAEQQLRKTQTDLIQAGKLAALGQMSAALSHELNQPLAAVKAYAENANTFLDRGMNREASHNVRQISALSDRMSSIAKHLRNFARRPQEKTIAVSLCAVIEDALAVMVPRITAQGAVVEYDKPVRDTLVIGGRVRLQQVVVNLVNNALDAMEGQKSPALRISLDQQGQETMIKVRDFGPGLSEEAMKLLFDPFFTTKDPGQGLGLGLSISYNIVRDFGGNIGAANHEDGGAVFTVTLKNAEDLSQAAQ